MPRRCLSIICAVALVTATSAPSVAAGSDPYLGSPHYGFDQYRRSTEITPGAYIRIPFSGTPRRSLSAARFGLTLGARMPAHDRYDSRRMLLNRPKFIDLSIGLAGKESLRLNGVSLADPEALHADDEEDEGRGIGPWIFGGLALLSAVSVVIIVVECSGGSDNESSC